MEDKRHCSLPGGRGSKLSPTAIQSERERERRRIRARVREQSDAVSSTPDRNTKCDEASGVPCKVPRFQYVDFPSLHQCIQQLSVPPLESWLSGCHAGMGIGMGRPAPGLTPTSPKERAPKFKYVDYPSLYHCIQQLSVPPLESWSATLPQPRESGGSGARTVTPSQAVSTRKEDQATQTSPSNTSGSARVQERCAVFQAAPSGDQAKERSRPEPNAPLNKPQPTDPAPHIPSSNGSKTGLLMKGSLDQGKGLSMTPDYHPGPEAHPDPYRASQRVSPKATRPSVISVHPGKEAPLKRRLQACVAGCPDSPQVASSARSECVCTVCQKMFAGPEELRKHQEKH